MADNQSSIELIPIESQTKTIQTCFQQCLYEVPNFQRPYSWTAEQLMDFWDDVVLAQGDFFFGSTVTWVSEKRELFNDTYSIIDGQQRLTTSAIMLSVIRDAFHALAQAEASDEEGFDPDTSAKQVTTTQKYLITADDDGRQYPVLRRPESMFYEHIQNPSAIPSGVQWNSSAKRIGDARKFFEDKIVEALQGLSKIEQVEKLKSVRANVLKARIIQVELASEEDGFLIFETLNTRGADLKLSDLVKNLLIRGGASSVEDRQAIASRWDRLIERVQDGRVNLEVADRFIWQSWNSRRTAVREPELFKKISTETNADASKCIELLEELELDSRTYEWLEYEDVRLQKKSARVRNAFAIPEFVDSVRAVAIFNVSVANSTLLAISRKFQETRLMKEAQLIEVARLVENFHFQFTALTNSGSTGGTRARYNRFAVRLEAAATTAEVADAISDFKSKLEASLPSRDRAEKAFRELFYAPSLQLTQAQKIRARKTFIAYVLMGFAKAELLLPAGQNLATWSIEHIKPQSQASGDVSDPVFSIGNLTLLTGPLNSQLGEADLTQKVEEFRKGKAYFDPKLEMWSDEGTAVPSDRQIEDRAAYLATEALGRVWSL